MSMVRFATLCDKCKWKSEEYTSWPSCKDCLEDICPYCDIPEARTEDERGQTLCKECSEERRQVGP